MIASAVAIARACASKHALPCFRSRRPIPSTPQPVRNTSFSQCRSYPLLLDASPTSLVPVFQRAIRGSEASKRINFKLEAIVCVCAHAALRFARGRCVRAQTYARDDEDDDEGVGHGQDGEEKGRDHLPERTQSSEEPNYLPPQPQQSFVAIFSARTRRHAVGKTNFITAGRHGVGQRDKDRGVMLCVNARGRTRKARMRRTTLTGILTAVSATCSTL